MANFPNDDLFESSKMSFGEHLEELRVSLFKGVVGLVLGFVVGLLVAHHVMNFVQRPLKLALENYYIDKAVEDLGAQYEGKLNDELRGFIRDKRLVFEEILVESSELNRVGQIVSAEQLRIRTTDSTKAPAASGTDRPASEKPAGEKLGSDKPAVKPDTESPPAVNGKADDKSAPAAVKDTSTEDAPSKSTKSADQPTDSSPAPALAAKDTKPAHTPEGSAKSSVAAAQPGKGSPEALQIIGETIPSPYSNLVRARVWKPVKMDVRALNAQEAFMIWMKAGFISGAIFASPWIFWQIWQFVAAGLYPHEKNYVYMYLPFSLLLFLAGASMAFFFVFEPVLRFLFSFNKSLNIDPDPRISEWLGFVLILPLGFGISFQLPLVMLFLNRIGLLSLEIYVQKWRVAVLAIFVISAILTPADPISIFLMAVPLTLLYFLGLGLCKWMPRAKNPYAEAYEP